MNEQIVNAIGWTSIGVISTLTFGTIIHNVNKYLKGLYHKDNPYRLQKDSGVDSLRDNVRDLRWEFQNNVDKIEKRLGEIEAAIVKKNNENHGCKCN